MYFKQWNRILSVICAAALSMSCMATLPAAATPINLVSNSTFDSGTSGWGKYQESGGSASLSTENGQLAVVDYLSNIQKKYEAAQRCLQAIENLRSGLLQQLFI